MESTRADREAEWYRRRRADKDSILLPQEFRLFDDEESMTVRFPVALVAPYPLSRLVVGSFLPEVLPWGSRGSVAAITLYVLIVAGLILVFYGSYLLVILIALATLAAVPLLLLGSLRRTVTIHAAGVEVGWWPLPFVARRLVFREIAQAFVVRVGKPTMDLFPGDPETSPGTSFEVWIVRRNGVRERLVGSMKGADHALYLERWIERRLGIEDAPVAGEYT